MNIQIRPMLVEEMELVKNAGVLDDHAIIAPTHVLSKNGELMGCLSVGAIPLVIPWLHREKCQAHDSARVVRDTENALRFAGHRYVAIPVHAQSPFIPFMEKAEYNVLLDCKLFVKVL